MPTLALTVTRARTREDFSPISILHRSPHSLQRRLAISAPGDRYEQEAERVSEQVMRMPEGKLSRTCACGGSCPSCRSQSSAAVPSPVRMQEGGSAGLRQSAVPDVVHDVLHSPGQPLDASARAFFEPRFGSDFSGVRVHADQRAAESARAVNALAYAVGPHVVFGAGQYEPQSSGGRHLLAHELTHVQQSDGGGGGETMFRTIAGWSRCPDGVNSAPDDVATELGAIDARTAEMAKAVSDLVGAHPPDADTLQAYEDRFGLPPAAGKGFLDRLTGTVKPTQEAATSAELSILSRRFAMVARLFREPLQYVCAGDAASVAQANVPNCEAFAWSRRGIGQIVLCPPFWNESANSDEQAAVLLHEAFHIILGPSDPRKIGEVGDVIFRGSGGRFVNAHCYNEFAAQLMGTTSPAVRCPAPES